MTTGEANPALLYRQSQVETAEPMELVNIVYTEAINTVTRCRQAFDEGNWEAVHNGLCKAQEILSELMGSLDPAGGEISRQLFSIYEYLHYLLVQANIKKDPSQLEQVCSMLYSLKTAWQEASRQIKEQTSLRREVSPVEG